MTAPLTKVESDAVYAASLALPPPQRPAFQERVAAELKSLPLGMPAPGTGSSPRVSRAYSRPAESPSAQAQARQAGRDQGQGQVSPYRASALRLQ
jgi:hypothetical protein